MAVLCRNVGLLFLLAPCTGSTATAQALIDQLGGEQIPSHDILATDGRLVVPTKHSTLHHLEAGGVLDAEEIRSLHVATTVRNPWDSLVSLYHKHRYD